MDYLQQLATLGYAVVPALCTDELDTARTLFTQWWDANDIKDRPIPPHGIIKHWNIGHTAFAWYLRTRPCVRGIWERIYGSKDLVVSFDGACYMPSSMCRRNPQKGWLHVDQAANNPNFACVQGFVSLTTNKLATLGLVPGSHLDFKDYTSGVQNRTKRYSPMPNIDPSMVIRVPVQAGDIVLWDSRVAHMNFYGPEERLVQYVSFLPKRGASSADLKKRRQYWYQRRTTSHWAYPLEVVGKQPQTYGDESLKIDYSGIIDPIDLEVWDRISADINKLL